MFRQLLPHKEQINLIQEYGGISHSKEYFFERATSVALSIYNSLIGILGMQVGVYLSKSSVA
jgi:hypothetical protein